MTPELTVLSLGAGQESALLFYLYCYSRWFRQAFAPGRYLVLMSDTGDEYPHTYEYVRYLEARARRFGIEMIFITADMGYHMPSWPSLTERYRRSNGCGSKSYPKSCTVNLKVVPFYNCLEAWVEHHYGLARGRKRGLVEFARRYGKIRVLIGIAGDEPQRISDGRERAPWMREAVEIRYPLHELGLVREDCQRAVAGFGEPVPWPSNCEKCPYSTPLDVLWLSIFRPDTYAEWVELERNKIDTNNYNPGVCGPKNYGVFGPRLLPEVLGRAQADYGNLSPAELSRIKFSRGHCVSSRY